MVLLEEVFRVGFAFEPVTVDAPGNPNRNEGVDQTETAETVRVLERSGRRDDAAPIVANDPRAFDVQRIH